MDDITAKLLKKASDDISVGEAIGMASIIPKFEGVLCRDWLQYAIVDKELQRVTILPSFLRSMEDVTRYIKAAEIIHQEAINMSRGLPE